MKKILFLLLCILSLIAETKNELYIKALEYEKQKEYKKAMYIYKKIASEDIPNKKKPLEKTIVDAKQSKTPDLVRRTEFVNSFITPLENEESHETAKQIISSSFDIYPYKANYFLPVSYDTKERSDRKQTEAKFQLSVRKPITYNLLGMNESINFAYTQTSWWQLYDESAPFRETNYQPELFVTIPYKKDSSLKAYKFAFLHESNGQGGEESRSWNRLYLQGFFQYNDLFISPRAWYRIPESDSNDDNPDITDYLGYGDLTFLYPYKRNTFKLKLRNNLDFHTNRTGTEFEYTFPLTSKKKSSYGFIQLFNGYGDSLIDYDENMSRISIGLSISR